MTKNKTTNRWSYSNGVTEMSCYLEVVEILMSQGILDFDLNLKEGKSWADVRKAVHEEMIDTADEEEDRYVIETVKRMIDAIDSATPCFPYKIKVLFGAEAVARKNNGMSIKKAIANGRGDCKTFEAKTPTDIGAMVVDILATHDGWDAYEILD